eukprot:3180904-Pyramimonas_sp.AAC.1
MISLSLASALSQGRTPRQSSPLTFRIALTNPTGTETAARESTTASRQTPPPPHSDSPGFSALY